MVYPFVVAAVSGLFAFQASREYAARHRPYQALWAFSLSISALAALAYVGAVSTSGGAAPMAFRLYYVCGALLVAPYTGMGSLYLVLNQSAGRRRLFWSVNIIASVGIYLMFVAHLDLAALGDLTGSSGRGVLEPGLWLVPMIILNIFGTAAVVGVALFSAWRAYQTKSGWSFMLGNGLISVGFLTVAMAGGAARWWPDWDGAFWVTMAAGWIIAFVGFRIIGRAAEGRAAQRTAIAGKSA